MPSYEDPEYGEYYIEDNDGPDPDGRETLNEVLWGSGYDSDPHAVELFQEAFFDKNDDAYQELVDYLWDQYGVDFEDAFDWADFREWAERNTDAA